MSVFPFSKRKILSAIPLALTASNLLAGPPLNQDKLVAANTAFAFDLMNRIVQAQPEANIFISPYSVSSALQMTAVGAAGQTKSEMQQVLKTAELSPEDLNGASQSLDRQFAARKEVVLNLANGLWVQAGFQLQPAFVNTNRKFYGAELGSVNFGDPQSAKTINDWAGRETKGKIQKVVHFPFPPLTRLVLANAIYFKGDWVTAFDKNGTRPRDFHPASGPSKPVPMMKQHGHFMYQETPDFQAIKLPYQGGLQMELYLPKTNSSPPKLLAGFLARGNWQQNIQAAFAGRDGAVILPKFKMQYEVRLNDPLQALGMKSAFSTFADFSGIASESLFISVVKQKSYVDVNETGTEAAAVTDGEITALSAPPRNHFTLVLDRPFFFVISDTATASILFLGIVNDPASGN